ncbi:MAG: hypothetical protein ACYSWP_15755 [Planctomycetota bacterium]|jgi:hypothetical protein
MVQLIKSPQVKVVTETKEGECQVHITLDINLHTDGTITARAAKEEPREEAPFLIPKFKSNEKVKFGERVTQEE